jgi:hypothetical protein
MNPGGIGSPESKKERIDMRTRLLGIAGLALGLTTLGGGVAAVSAHGSTAVPLSASVSTSHLVGAGLSAPLYQLAPSTTQDPACAAQDQNQPDAAETNAAGAADTDTVDLQCGDQTGADTGGTDSGAGSESAAGTEAPGSGDQAIDGLDQQGQN